MMNLQLFSPRFKAGLTLAFMLCTFAAFGQYPAQPNKIALGRQTTGDGLIFRTSGQPSWTPSTVFNAWMAIDTTTGNMWTYREGAWFLEVAGDLKVDYPKVINKSGVNILRGQVVMVDTVQLVQGDQVRIRPAIATMSNSQFVMGVASEDIPNDSSSYVTWFGYVREVKHADIAQTGVTLDVGDILYISATQAGRYTDTEPAAPNLNSTMALVVRKPSANNMTLLVRPWLNEKLGDLRDVDLSGIANGQGISWDSVNRKFIPATFGSGSVTSIATNNGITGGTITTSGTIGLTGQALALHNIGGTGFFTRGAGGSIALRSIGAGTGISISDASGLSGNPTITNSAPDQTVVLTAGTGISTSGTYPNFTINNSAPDQTVSITGAGINAVTGTYPNFTITATEVDGSITNEGILGVGAGGANTAVINSNTSTASGVTINGGVGALVTETTSSNGGTINVLVDTANIVSKTFLTNQGYTSNAGTVTSIATGYGLDGGTITTSGTLSVDTLEIATPYDVSLKQDKLTGTGLVKSTSGTISYITDNSANWDAAYNDRITSAAFSGSGTKTLTLTQQDAGTITASFTDLQGVTSITAGVGLTGGTITTSGTIDADTTNVLASKTWVQTRGYLTSEVDGSVTNEGVLGVGAGGDNTATITSNTSGANGVTVSGGVGIFISESTSSNGGTITARIDTANIVTKTFLSNQAYTSNTGTVTSIATNNGITGGTITTTGTIGLTGNALGLHQLASNGMLARTGAGAIAARTITAGTGISVSNGDGVSGNPTITNSAPDQTVSITGAGINSVTGTYPNFTITGTEVDGSTSNEGTLGVGAGGANTAVITSNTSGASGVTIAGGTNVTITESTSSNGGTITINAGGGGGGYANVYDYGASPAFQLNTLQFDTISFGFNVSDASQGILVTADTFDYATDKALYLNINVSGNIPRRTELADSTAALRAAFPTNTVKGTGAANKVAIWASSDSLYQNTNLHWDNSNGRLGINNTSPVERLQVGGNVRAERFIFNSYSTQALSINNIAPTGAQGFNLFIGTEPSNMTIAGDADNASQNFGIGNSALINLTSGRNNLALGNFSLPNLTTGSFNTSVGGAFFNLTTGSRNFGLGAGVFNGASTTNDNVGIGHTAGYSSLGSNNVYIGSEVIQQGSGSNNTLIGYRAGFLHPTSGFITALDNSTLIGADARPSASGNTNEIVIGFEGRGQGSNTAIVGNSSITNTYLRGKVSVNTTASANTLDVEGGAAIGATYSGTNTAPTNGLLVEGDVGIGRSNPSLKLDVAGQFGANYNSSYGYPTNILNGNLGGQFYATHALGNWGFVITRASNDSGNPNLTFFKTRNVNSAIRIPVQTNDEIGRIVWQGVSDTTQTLIGAQIGTIVTGSVALNSLPTALTFSTTETSSVAEKMRLTHDGKLGIGTSSPQNRLDVEGGAAIGATYSGTSTAPTNGLLVEGVFGLGTNILTSGFQMHMYGRKKTELIESNNTTTDKGHEYSNSQTFTTLNTTFSNNFNRTLNSVVMSGNSTVKANNFGDILQTSYTLSDTANLIYGTNMSVKAKILRQNSNRGLVNKLRYITFDTLDTQGTGTPNINIKRFEGLAIQNLTTAPSGITTDTVMAIYIAQQKGGSTSAAYSIYSEGGTMYHEGAIQTKGTLSRSTFQTVTGATANVGTDATWVICNRAGTINLTLPSASANPGRELTIKTITANAVNSAVGVNNVIPIDSDVAGNTILPATDGAWALLVSNGTNWVIMQKG